MRRRIRRERPDARVEGFTVEPMYRRPDSHELIVGAYEDSQFGPVVLFGHGGVAVEVRDDKALGLPPLNDRLAREMIGRTRISRLLGGFRNLPAVDLEAVAGVLTRVSQLVVDLPEIVELDINPLVADPGGVLAIDVRVRVAPPRLPGSDRLAIRPYPRHLERMLAGDRGAALTLRPVRPADAALTRAVAERPGDFHVALRRPELLAMSRLAQIDYDRDMVLLLLDAARPGAASLLGIALLNADPDGERADCGLVVHRALDARAADALLADLVDYAAARGIVTLCAWVPAGEPGLVDTFRRRGFAPSPDDPGPEDTYRLVLQPLLR
jgi:acetyltransferase